MSREIEMPDPTSVDRSKVTKDALKEIFTEQHQYINYFFEHLDFAQMEKFTQLVLDCKGLIFLTGTPYMTVFALVCRVWGAQLAVCQLVHVIESDEINARGLATRGRRSVANVSNHSQIIV